MNFLGTVDPVAAIIALLGFVIAITANVLWIDEIWNRLRTQRRPTGRSVSRRLRVSVIFVVGRAPVKW